MIQSLETEKLRKSVKTCLGFHFLGDIKPIVVAKLPTIHTWAALGSVNLKVVSEGFSLNPIPISPIKWKSRQVMLPVSLLCLKGTLRVLMRYSKLGSGNMLRHYYRSNDDNAT